MMYCGPSQQTVPLPTPPSSRPRSIRRRAHTDNSFFFVTQNHSSRERPPSRARAPYRRLSELNSYHMAQPKGWEPLTKSALLEHARVQELQVPSVQKPITPNDEWNFSLSRAMSSRAKGRLGSPTGYKQYGSLGSQMLPITFTASTVPCTRSSLDFQLRYSEWTRIFSCFRIMAFPESQKFIPTIY